MDDAPTQDASMTDGPMRDLERAQRIRPDLSRLHTPARQMAERWAPPELLQESVLMSQRTPVRTRQVVSARSSRRSVESGATAGNGTLEPILAYELRDQIEDNRMRWMSNAEKSPFSQQGQMKLLGGSISGFAVVSALTVVITIAAGLLYNQASKATKLALDPSATTISGVEEAGNSTSKSAAQ